MRVEKERIAATMVDCMSMETVRNNLSEHVPRIVLGGAAYRRPPRFAREIEAAEAIPDLRQALAVLCA